MKSLDIKRLITGALVTLSSSFSFAETNITVEWAPFVIKSNVTKEQVINAADQVNLQFLSAQKGYIKRQLIQKSNTEFADIVHWESLADAQAAGDKVMSCKTCITYFALMDMSKAESAGSGFSHSKVLMNW
jgi:hypothetical protein